MTIDQDRATTDEITCQELVEVITDYLEGVMPPAEAQRFEAHLADCRGCTTYVEQMRQTIQTTGASAPEPIPTGIREELLAAFRAWTRRR